MLDSNFFSTIISKRKNKQGKVNLKTISITNLNNQRRIEDLKRSFSSTMNYSNPYEKSFLKPEYSIEQKCHFYYDLKRNHVDDILNGNLTMKDFHNKLQNTFDYKRNKSYNISPNYSIIFRNNSSRERSMKNIDSIRKNLEGDIKINYKEVNKINRILGNNYHNNLRINVSPFKNDNNNFYKSQSFNYKNIFSHIKNLTSNENKSRNYFNEKNKKKLNSDLFTQFEYNRNFIKHFKKEKIHKRFPKNELEQFSNGLLVSPYV